MYAQEHTCDVRGPTEVSSLLLLCGSIIGTQVIRLVIRQSTPSISETIYIYGCFAHRYICVQHAHLVSTEARRGH